jgi:hypothetical protein
MFRPVLEGGSPPAGASAKKQGEHEHEKEKPLAMASPKQHTHDIVPAG